MPSTYRFKSTVSEAGPSLLPLLEGLLKQSPKMQISISTEVLNGVWDSLATNRADIVIGSDPFIPESLGAVSSFELGYFEFVFAVATKAVATGGN